MTFQIVNPFLIMFRCLTSKHFKRKLKKKKFNYVHRHQFQIFHHSLMHRRELFEPQHHQNQRDYVNIHALVSLNCLMHNVSEMIYWFHFNVSMAINNARNDGTAIKLHGSSHNQSVEKEAKRLTRQKKRRRQPQHVNS